MSASAPETPAAGDAFAALRFAEYRNLILGNFLFTIAITIQEIAIAYELYLITHDPLVLGLLGLAEALVREHRAAVEAVADALVARDVLDADEVIAIARAHGVAVRQQPALAAA